MEAKLYRYGKLGNIIQYEDGRFGYKQFYLMSNDWLGSYAKISNACSALQKRYQ